MNSNVTTVQIDIDMKHSLESHRMLEYESIFLSIYSRVQSIIVYFYRDIWNLVRSIETITLSGFMILVIASGRCYEYPWWFRTITKDINIKSYGVIVLRGTKPRVQASFIENSTESKTFLLRSRFNFQHSPVAVRVYRGVSENLIFRAAGNIWVSYVRMHGGKWFSASARSGPVTNWHANWPNDSRFF